MTPAGEQHLQRIEEMVANIKRIELRIAVAVAEARIEHASWTDVGLAAGMTKQAAHEKWSGRAREVRADGNVPLFAL